MQKITPHLWFDKEAKQAAELYASVFPNSRIKDTNVLRNTPSGTVELVTAELAGQTFRLMSAGPFFKFTPAVSFLVACETKAEVDAVWKKLAEGGVAMMPLDAYPFSERYGWTQDRFGVSWQVMYMGGRPITQKIIPTLMFTGAVAGKAEEAIKFYSSVFHDAKVGHMLRWAKDEGPDPEGNIKHAGFTLEGQEFAAMDSAYQHGFSFNEAISLTVRCETQEEIDYFWDKLSADAKAEQCGWLKDKFGLSWQIVPAMMDEVFRGKDEKTIARVTQAFLKMKKFDIAKLKEAAEGAAA